MRRLLPLLVVTFLLPGCLVFTCGPNPAAEEPELHEVDEPPAPEPLR